MTASRLKLQETAPAGYAAVSGVEVHTRGRGLEKSLIEALAWSECLADPPSRRAPDDVHTALCQWFSDLEIANLTILIGLINL